MRKLVRNYHRQWRAEAVRVGRKVDRVLQRAHQRGGRLLARGFHTVLATLDADAFCCISRARMTGAPLDIIQGLCSRGACTRVNGVRRSTAGSEFGCSVARISS